MNVIRTEIHDVLILQPTVYSDERGWFMESFNEASFYQHLDTLSISRPKPFVQDNHSCSSKGVLRGLHFQAPPYEQGKLVRVTRGAAFDVAVDIRKDSPTYLKWVGVRLDCISNFMLWIPEGFAHGFLALEDDTHFLYKTSDYYNKASEGSLLWNDPLLGIQWPVCDTYIVSAKDCEAPTL